MSLEALFPKVRREVLTLFLLHPVRELGLREVVREIAGGHGAVQRELARLVTAGILLNRREGQRTLFRANEESFIFPELKQLVEKTVGPAGRIREVLLHLAPRIRAAYLYGSVPAGTSRGSSDVDLMVIGEVTFGEVTEVLPQAERDLQREINPTIYPLEEYRSKLAVGNPFLATVIASPRQFVIGDPRELEDLG